MSFAKNWAEAEKSLPPTLMDKMDNMDTIRVNPNSVHSVHFVPRVQTQRIEVSGFQNSPYAKNNITRRVPPPVPAEPTFEHPVNANPDRDYCRARGCAAWFSGPPDRACAWRCLGDHVYGDWPFDLERFPKISTLAECPYPEGG